MEDFPTTWGKFSIIYDLITYLPPGSEVATRDVAEVYRTIPLHPSQWPANVVRISESLGCIDTNLAFRATLSAGVYGHLSDAFCEILHHHGMGPLDKWVDDHIFFCICKEHLATYNQTCLTAHQDILQHPPLPKFSGSRLWFQGHPHSDTTTAEFTIPLASTLSLGTNGEPGTSTPTGKPREELETSAEQKQLGSNSSFTPLPLFVFPTVPSLPMETTLGLLKAGGMAATATPLPMKLSNTSTTSSAPSPAALKSAPSTFLVQPTLLMALLEESSEIQLSSSQISPSQSQLDTSFLTPSEQTPLPTVNPSSH
ncbi:hypothetical protein ID866_10899 [Astraeus odoratus]|nr:hypothetical protein ID866_10899 [Astraeus odoratus]